MKLFIVSTDNYTYDEFDSLVIAAESEEQAIDIALRKDDGWASVCLPCKRNEIKIEYIGEYYKEESGIVHSSYNAG